MSSLYKDLSYGLRTLAKRPAFTLVVLLTLSLGIGVNTAAFSVASGVLLRPLAFEDPRELLVIDESVQPQGWRKPCRAVTLPELEEFEKHTDILSAAGGFQEATFTMTGAGQPQRLAGGYVTSGLFRALRVRPAVGRLFLADDDVVGGPKIAVISHRLWQGQFGCDPNLIGETVFLDKIAHTVVGVLPPRFDFPLSLAEPDVFTPLPNDRGQYHQQRWRMLTTIARLRPEVTPRDAQPLFDRLAGQFAQENPKQCANCKIDLVPLHEYVVGNTRSLLMLLLGAAGVVLLIACVNVANLLLARGSQRRKELALRAALGAGRLRLLRQTLTESVLLGVVGGLLGLLAAVWGTDALVALLPDEIPRAAEIGIDWRVLCFIVAVSILTGLMVGLPTAAGSLKLNLQDAFKGGGWRGISLPGRSRLQRGLVISEIGLALMLLIGAGLLTRSFHSLMSVDPGFAPDKVLTFRMLLDMSTEKRQPPCDELLTRLAGLPGVQSVGVCDGAPLTGQGWSTNFKVIDGPQLDAHAKPMAAFSSINPDYFSTIGIPLLAGRVIAEQDTLDSTPVMVVNEAFARRFLPDENPIGKHIKVGARVGDTYPDTFEIVGVVGDIHDKGLDVDESPRMCVPFAQHPRGYVNFFVRSRNDPLSLVAPIRAEAAAVVPDQATFSFSTLDGLIADSVAPRRFPTLMISITAGLALILAAIGIYGVLSYTVAQRTHEIGIRAALGAQAGDVLRLVLRQALALALIGVCLGLAGAFATTRLISAWLFQVTPTDPITFVTTAVALVVLALLASYLPARRATMVDPVVALRCE